MATFLIKSHSCYGLQSSLGSKSVCETKYKELADLCFIWKWLSQDSTLWDVYFLHCTLLMKNLTTIHCFGWRIWNSCKKLWRCRISSNVIEHIDDTLKSLWASRMSVSRPFILLSYNDTVTDCCKELYSQVHHKLMYLLVLTVSVYHV